MSRRRALMSGRGRRYEKLEGVGLEKVLGTEIVGPLGVGVGVGVGAEVGAKAVLGRLSLENFLSAFVVKKRGRPGWRLV